jgi:MFS family permease
MICMDLLRTLVVFGFFFTETLWQIYALALLMHLGSALFTPVYKAVIPGIVGATHYPRALAFGTVAYDLSNIAGPSLAALVIALAGYRGNFLVDAFTFLFSALLSLSIRIDPADRPGPGPARQKSELLYGARKMLTVPGLLASLFLALRVSIVGGLALVATVNFVKIELALSDALYAWTMTALGLGSAAGALVYAGAPLTVQQRIGRLVLPGFFLSLVLAALAGNVAVLMVAWVISGAGQSVYGIMSNQLLAANSSDEDRPHIYAAHFSLSHAGWGITYPLAGILATQFGFHLTSWIFCGILALTLLPYLAGVRFRLPDAD